MTKPGVKLNLPAPRLEYFILLTLGQKFFLHSGIKLERSEEKSFFFNNCIYLFLAVQSLRCCVGISLVVASRGYSLVANCRL